MPGRLVSLVAVGLAALGRAIQSSPPVSFRKMEARYATAQLVTRWMSRSDGNGDDDEAAALRARAAALREEVAALQAQADAARQEEPEPKVEEQRRKPPPPPPPPPTLPKRPEQRGRESDAPPWADRAIACLPYVLPLSDVLPFGKFVLTDFPVIAVALVGPVAPLLAILNAVPFGGLIVFIALSSQTRNPQLPRFTRFSMQQAIILDIALIFPQLLGQLGSAIKLSPPEALIEPASTTVFFAVSLSIVYAVAANLRGELPNGIPLVSEATERSIGKSELCFVPLILFAGPF